ncbi:hypothetical protein [Silvanigrella sp.]|jgi:hypothetical protein|uniref:hypothetical protein n=1 Tax=Silvanigrella sp. TaxID=2024976 RepID=UPI0037CA3B5E
MNKSIRYLVLSISSIIIANSSAQEAQLSENEKIQNECKRKTDSNIERLKSFGYTSYNYSELLSKCVKHLTIISEFKISNTASDLKELFDQTKSKLNTRISELNTLILDSNDENTTQEYWRQISCFTDQLNIIQSISDEDLMVEKKNLNIFEYKEGNVFKNGLIYANNSLKNNCAK